MLKEYIDKRKDEIIEEVCNIVRIPSVHEESTDEKKPFGENANKALEYILALGERLGFRTKNLDGYCGYLEFGEGEEILGIIGHLDVVPVGDGWTYEPFNPIIDNDKLYGRGTTDDKGPVIAALYAMKAVMDLCKVNKRVRLIVGLNEERDWKCIEHYKKVEEMPTLGFSPDADFPCIYAEKGLLSIYVSEIYTGEIDSIKIEKIDYRNNAINVVPKYCSMILRISKTTNIDEVKDTIEMLVSKYEFEIKVEKIEENKLKVESFGKAAHAAHPELGENAISKLIVCLAEVFEIYEVNNNFIKTISEKINLETNGESLGIGLKDDMGELTLNVAKLYLENNKIVLGANLRIPVTYKINFVEDLINDSLNDNNLEIEFTDKKESLYIPKEDELVQKLCGIYNYFYGKNEEPIAIGGATYARAFKNCVSFGAMMPDEEDMCHKADEYIKIDNLINSCKIYAKAIAELTK